MSVEKLDVFYHDRFVGTLAEARDRKIAFRYSDSWLRDGFPVSPFSLPLKRDVFLPKNWHFEGLFGVFADSLPDAWGRLLLSRLLRRNGVEESGIGMLDRLAIVGSSGMGALCYRPEKMLSGGMEAGDLDRLAEECRALLETSSAGMQDPKTDAGQLDELYAFGGTSGGARPKAMISLEGREWIVKFPAHTDPEEIGRMEYDYAVCAGRCGIRMAEIRLFPAKRCAGYFGCRRFDRGESGQRFHMLTAAALLELDFRTPSLDYADLMKMAGIFGFGKKDGTEELYRRMCFNVYAHNQDDHAKNFTWLYDEGEDLWKLSPAYDLTYSRTSFGEQTTTVRGKGRGISDQDLTDTGRNAGLKEAWCRTTADEIRRTVREELGKYLQGGRR